MSSIEEILDRLTDLEAQSAGFDGRLVALEVKQRVLLDGQMRLIEQVTEVAQFLKGNGTMTVSVVGSRLRLAGSVSLTKTLVGTTGTIGGIFALATKLMGAW